MFTLTRLIFAKINFARFLRSFFKIHKNLPLQKFLILAFVKINASETFRVKVEAVLMFKKNIFLDNLVDAY